MSIVRDLLISWLDLPTAQPVERADSNVYSPAMGFGVSRKDRVNDVVPKDGLVWWNRSQLRHSFVRGGIARRLCMAPPADAMAGGYTVNTKAEEDEALPRRLRAAARMVQARQLARGERESVLYVRVGGDQTEELTDGPHDIRAVHVLTAEEATPVDWNGDPDDVDWTEATHWDLTPNRTGLSFSGQRVHASRVIPLHGLDVPPGLLVPGNARGAAVLDVYWEAIRNYELVTGATTSLMTELSMLVLEVDSNGPRSGSDRQSWIEKVRQIVRSRSVLGAMGLPPGWRVSRSNASISGWRDGMLSAYEGLAAPEGIAPSISVGVTPSGFANDDKAGTRNYHRHLNSVERAVFTEVILRLHEIAFGPDDTREVVWPPLEELTALERAQVSALLAQRDAALYGAQLIERPEVRGRFLGSKELEHVQRDEAFDDVEEADPEPVPPELDLDAPDDEPDEDPGDDPDRADAQTYQPPKGAQGNARKVLRWRDEHGDAVKGMTSVGWRRARQLASGKPVSRDVVGRMAAFARHRKNAKVDPKFKDEPWRDAGYVAWLGWGGDSGINWAASVVAAED